MLQASSLGAKEVHHRPLVFLHSKQGLHCSAWCAMQSCLQHLHSGFDSEYSL